MKLISYRNANGASKIGALVAGGVVDLCAADPAVPPTMRLLLEAGPDALERVRIAVERVAPQALVRRDQITLLPPVPDPSKIVCIGLNYRDHAAEVKLDLPEFVTVFAKWPNSLIGDGTPIVIPRESHRVDYEAELAFVIGTRAHRVTEADAYGVIAGYTCFNDVSVRDYQMRTSQWMLGKVFDSHGPCGPALVTRDEVRNPGNLRIQLSIGDEVLQDSSTSQLVFGIPRLIAELTAVMTLEPGDIVATGTPAGVGTSRNPRRWIGVGERVRVEIEAVGILENPAIADRTA